MRRYELYYGQTSGSGGASCPQCCTDFCGSGRPECTDPALLRGEDRADHILELMAMEARAGDFIEIQACGEDAEQAVKTIAQILQK